MHCDDLIYCLETQKYQLCTFALATTYARMITIFSGPHNTSKTGFRGHSVIK